MGHYRQKKEGAQIGKTDLFIGETQELGRMHEFEQKVSAEVRVSPYLVPSAAHHLAKS
jgi:hypothetical protein